MSRCGKLDAAWRISPAFMVSHHFRVGAAALLFVTGLGIGKAQSVYATPYATTTLAGVPPADRYLAVRGAPFWFPVAVAVDRVGNVYVADHLSHTIQRISPSGVVTILAGKTGESGSADGSGSEARFNEPNGVTVDGAGNVYVADFQSSTIRKITPTGLVTTLAGTAGRHGSTDGTGSEARFNGPVGLALDGPGNVFVADANNSTIRKISPAGVVTTFAGTAGSYGPGRGGQFRRPYGVAVDNSGHVYVSDHIAGSIHKITPDGVVTTLAGGSGRLGIEDGIGSTARFSSPFGVAVDHTGNVYVADAGNHTIRKILPTGEVTTLVGMPRYAGSADGSGSAARFNAPYGVAIDAAGNLYVADTFNTTVRKIDRAGVVNTFAGLVASSGSVDGTGKEVRLNGPNAAAVDSAGNVFVADTANHTIRRISRDGAVTTFAGSAGVSGYVDGMGNAARFALPCGIAVDGVGNMYVADKANFRIRKITAAGEVTTLAGGGEGGATDDGLGPAARFYGLESLAVDNAGNIYATDTLVSRYSQTSTVRKISPTGSVSTLAGRPFHTGRNDGVGGDAQFKQAAGIAVDKMGYVYVADAGSHTIRKITPAGEVTTIAGLAGVMGNSDGAGRNARFYTPHGVAVDSAGNLFIIESINGTIRKMTSGGTVTTVAGMTAGIGYTDGVGSSVRFSYPKGVAVDGFDNVYIADTGNNTIRKAMLVAVSPERSRLTNVSTRGLVPAGGALTTGFVISGTGAKQLVVRGIGPTLDAFHVTSPLRDVAIDINVQGSPASFSNDDWGGSGILSRAFASVGAFALSADSKDAAVQGVFEVNSNGHTAWVAPAGLAASGIALAEIYDADPMSSEAHLGNVSTLGHVGTGENTLILGFAISGSTPKQVLIRAIGPGLSQFGVGGLLSDPRLVVFRAEGSAMVASNDDWGGTEALKSGFAQGGAFSLAEQSKDAAIMANLMPGTYTVVVSGAGGTGNALVEVYDINP